MLFQSSFEMSRGLPNIAVITTALYTTKLLPSSCFGSTPLGIRNPNCANLYKKSKILRHCSNFKNHIKLKAILIHLKKPKLCKNNIYQWIT